MAFELIYTSAPQGIRPGSSGFCVVAHTKGLAPNLALQLESLSAYQNYFPHYDENALKNPVAYSHYIASVQGEELDLLSRICFCGLDYTKRSNKLAHHVVMKSRERTDGGPAAIFYQEGLFRKCWDGEPQIFAEEKRIAPPEIPLRKAEVWAAYSGDAGWAGVLAEQFLAAPRNNVWILFDPLRHTDLLSLVEEALLLLPASVRWQVTFNTYFTVLPAGFRCGWRFCTPGSDAWKDAGKIPGNRMIDLTRPLPPAGDGKLQELARRGVPPDLSSPDFRAEESGKDIADPDAGHGGSGKKKIALRIREPEVLPGPPSPQEMRKTVLPQTKKSKIPLFLLCFALCLVFLLGIGGVGTYVFFRLKALQTARLQEIGDEKKKDAGNNVASSSSSAPLSKPERKEVREEKKKDGRGKEISAVNMEAWTQLKKAISNQLKEIQSYLGKADSAIDFREGEKDLKEGANAIAQLNEKIKGANQMAIQIPDYSREIKTFLYDLDNRKKELELKHGNISGKIAKKKEIQEKAALAASENIRRGRLEAEKRVIVNDAAELLWAKENQLKTEGTALKPLHFPSLLLPSEKITEVTVLSPEGKEETIEVADGNGEWKVHFGGLTGFSIRCRFRFENQEGKLVVTSDVPETKDYKIRAFKTSTDRELFVYFKQGKSRFATSKNPVAVIWNIIEASGKNDLPGLCFRYSSPVEGQTPALQDILEKSRLRIVAESQECIFGSFFRKEEKKGTVFYEYAAFRQLASYRKQTAQWNRLEDWRKTLSGKKKEILKKWMEIQDQQISECQKELNSVKQEVESCEKNVMRLEKGIENIRKKDLRKASEIGDSLNEEKKKRNNSKEKQKTLELELENLKSQKKELTSDPTGEMLFDSLLKTIPLKMFSIYLPGWKAPPEVDSGKTFRQLQKSLESRVTMRKSLQKELECLNRFSAVSRNGTGEILAADRNDVLMSVRMTPFTEADVNKMKKMLDFVRAQLEK